MIRYVLGFGFDDHRRLALIRKKRPTWQAGRWNGIGGKVQEFEGCREAMAREFAEETGVLVEAPLWRKVAIMTGRVGTEDEWTVHVYTAQDRAIGDACTQTDEDVRLVSCVSFKRVAHECIENVSALIEICNMGKDHTGGFPIIKFEYP
jgi:8-oxo-dGTP pyrophosphatase MutT (NUDIX family)